MNPDKLFFTSDPHFGHQLMAGRRGYADVDAMDHGLIRFWNQLVPRDGDVFLLGDVSFHKNQATAAILAALNGRIHLVRGNHDKRLNGAVMERFSSVDWYRMIRVEQTKIVMCHFPISAWDCAHHGAWHLHGHSHGSCPPLGRRMDVGVDCHSMRPVSFRELVPLMGMRPIECGDGHKAPEKNERHAP